jgi:integrase/recombinase XerD
LNRFLGDASGNRSDDPLSAGVATRVLAIPLKRTNQRLVGYLTRPEIDAILAANNLSEWSGRRDHVLLLTLYNTGARVSEITSLEQRQCSLGTKSFVQFNGKGRKERSVPLSGTTAKALKAWFSELSDRRPTIAFPNAHGSALTRDGVNYILQQATERATAAFHLLQSGVDIAVIPLWLGHENIQTTHGYLEADLLIKERALQKLAPAGQATARFKPDDALLAFLTSGKVEVQGTDYPKFVAPNGKEIDHGSKHAKTNQ